jgi:hypothetical protein
MLPLEFTSKEAQVEAERLQRESLETMPYEPVAEVISQWLDAPLSAEAVSIQGSGHKIDREFDDEGQGGATYVRNLVTATMLRLELAQNPIIRELRGSHAEKTIGQALASLGDWEKLGHVHRAGRKARWYSRTGFNSKEEFVVPLSRSQPDTEIEDLLG